MKNLVHVPIEQFIGMEYPKGDITVFSVEKKAVTEVLSNKFNSLLDLNNKFSNPSFSNNRFIADPTIPLCPEIYIFEDLFILLINFFNCLISVFF